MFDEILIEIFLPNDVQDEVLFTLSIIIKAYIVFSSNFINHIHYSNLR